jgi:hypothetical protein
LGVAEPPAYQVEQLIRVDRLGHAVEGLAGR